MTRYAGVIVDISHEKLDKTFQYRIPENLMDVVEVGTAVNVPFGMGNRLTNAYVVDISDKIDYDPARIKELHSIARDKNSIESHLIALAAWIKRNYGGTMNQAIRTVIPVRRKITEKEKRLISLLIDREDAINIFNEMLNKHRVAQARLIGGLLDQSPLPYEIATGKLNIAPNVIRNLAEKGYIKVESSRVYRNPLERMKKTDKKVALNPVQREIAQDIIDRFDEDDLRPSLIFGVTGSGKTEVYISLIKDMIARGKQTIVLIPEIALTYQTVIRFYNHFGDRVSILNSKMSQGERSDQFDRAKDGKIDVIIGPRSALFTPFENLGMIIIDEEHEISYKSENVPRYHAREVAIARAKMCGGMVVLGSATPSLESYNAAEEGRNVLYEMKERLSSGELPKVHTVDLRDELRKGNRSILSDKLRSLMEDRLQKHEQIMIFINRRGMAGFVSCRSCGEVMKCPHCDVSMTLHKNDQLECHYCGHKEPMVKACPKCGSKYIGTFKAGTEKIEEYIKSQFPGVRTLRMDMDTTRTKDSYENILTEFANHNADILIGTQMIVKGHDFPNVTLVGILAADLSLNISDYRAAERTFQLLTQAAGRAGRANKPGEVVIQTYQPDHYSIVSASVQDYEKFYEREIAYRKLMNYPPGYNMLVIHGSSADLDILDRGMTAIKKNIEGYINNTFADSENASSEFDGISIIGPADEAVSRVNDIYRKMCYIKAGQYSQLIKIKDSIEDFVEKGEMFGNINIQFDFNN